MRAVVFAGQGAQAVGMGRDLAESNPDIRALYERAKAELGYDLARLCWEGPEDELVKSDRCQPAIFVTSAACWEALRRARPGLSVQAAAGLSLGEWTALWLAGAVSFEEALRILAARGRFIQEACDEQPGAMLSVIGLDPGALEAVAAKAGVEIANYNSPEQTVLSGRAEGIQAAERLAREAGAKRVVPLAVAGAFHSSLMASAARRLDEFLRSVSFRPPSLPVLSNVTGRLHGGPEEIRRAMVKQVTSPVRWLQGVQHLRQQGLAAAIECGPGRVLSGLIKRTAPDVVLANVQDAASLAKTAAALSD